jgi:murein hydrolase activator
VKFLALLLICTNLFADSPKNIKAKLESTQKAFIDQEKQFTNLKESLTTIEQEIKSLTSKMIKTARDIQKNEGKIEKCESNCKEIIQKKVKLQQSLDTHRGQYSKILSVMQRLSINPPQSLLGMPLTPHDTIKSITLLDTTLKLVRNFSHKIKQDMQNVETLHDDYLAQKKSIATTQKILLRKQNEIQLMVKAKKQFKMETSNSLSQEQQNLEKLSAKIDNLNELLGEIKKQQTVRTRKHQISKAKKELIVKKATFQFPVKGKLKHRFGHLDDKMIRGVEFETQANAQVICPYDGRVSFAGPFRHYDNVVILEHSGGYHTVLIGLKRIDCEAGQMMVLGEPIGIMGENAPPENKSSLYLEFRYNSQPIDPLPWYKSK